MLTRSVRLAAAQTHGLELRVGPSVKRRLPARDDKVLVAVLRPAWLVLGKPSAWRFVGRETKNLSRTAFKRDGSLSPGLIK